MPLLNTALIILQGRKPSFYKGDNKGTYYVYFIQHLTINWCLSQSFNLHKFSLLSEHSNNVGWYPFRKGWQNPSLVIPGLLAQTDPDKWLWHWSRLYRSGFSLQTFNGNSKSHWLASKSRESLAQTSTGNGKEHWFASKSRESLEQTSTGNGKEHWFASKRRESLVQTSTGKVKPHCFASRRNLFLEHNSTGNWNEHWLASRNNSLTQSPTGTLNPD